MVKYLSTLFCGLVFFVSVSCSLLPFSNKASDIFDEIIDSSRSEERFNLDNLPTLKDENLDKYLRTLSKKISDFYKISPVPVVVVDSIEAQGLMDFNGRTIFLTKGMLYGIQNESELIA